MNRTEFARAQLSAARHYTLGLLAEIRAEDWFRMPAEGVTHIAWQVGHLAFAEYRLAVERVRGPREEDAGVISPAFLKLFGRESVPAIDPAFYPRADTIRAVFDWVHDQALAAIEPLDDAALDTAMTISHRRFTTREGAILWCAQHEMLHAGQIGLVRRLLGAKPIW